MASPTLHGLVEDPMFSKASLSSPPLTSSAPVCGEGMIPSSSGGCNLSTGLSSILGLGDDPGTVRGASSTVMDLFPSPLPDVPNVQQVVKGFGTLVYL
ncbi:hypothetical protein LWI29_019283 [Acer saccharum]|uniref:Uncharacterized protein n=1 Tax=Acer saccharum TaxID=4024 RepID=A0AA39STA4_ACESA|nr:hypothetical protein LWI29_019283 [Acer saccharum]